MRIGISLGINQPQGGSGGVSASAIRDRAGSVINDRAGSPINVRT